MFIATELCDYVYFFYHVENENSVKNIQSTDILGAIALIGMLAYALIYGMDSTTSAMLTGLFGVLLGRNMRTPLEK